MKKLLVSTLLFGAFHAFAADDGELECLAQMTEAVQTKTIEEFMDAIRENKWVMPRIPSKWHVETKVTDKNEQRRLFAARDFGYQLALRLETLAQEQKTIRSRSVLHERTQLIFDLSDWCAEPVGYGNFFLARECLNVAVLGVNRLTASMEFPLEKCEGLGARLSPKWLVVPRVLMVLNDEADSKIFTNDKVPYDKLVDLWRLGRWLRERDGNTNVSKDASVFTQFGLPPPSRTPDAKFVNVELFMNNLDFFVETEMHPLGPIEIIPLPPSWEYRQHARLFALTGFTGWRDNALSLIKFRSIVGFFPPPFVRTPEEIKQSDIRIAEYAKKGISVGKLEDSRSYDPLKIAFSREWEKTKFVNGKYDLYNDYLPALFAYKEAKSASLLDEK